MVIHVSKLVVSMLCLLVCLTLVLTPYFAYLINIEEGVSKTKLLLISVNYPLYVDTNFTCLLDPFAGGEGFIAHTFLVKFNRLSNNVPICGDVCCYNFYSLSSGTIQGRSYTYSLNPEQVIQNLYFYFTSSTTTSVTIGSYIYAGSCTGSNAVTIPSRTYDAYQVYRYRLVFNQVDINTTDYQLTVMLGVPSYNVYPVTLSHMFFNNGNSVSLTPTYRVSYTTPTSGSTTWVVNYVIDFTSSSDVGKTFNEYYLLSSCSSCSPSWSNLVHIYLKLNTPFTIELYDRIVISFTINLVSS